MLNNIRTSTRLTSEQLGPFFGELQVPNKTFSSNCEKLAKDKKLYKSSVMMINVPDHLKEREKKEKCQDLN